MQQPWLFKEGVYTVLVTPFDDDNNVNYNDIEKWIKKQSTSGIAGVVLLGTTSENPTLSKDEQLEIVKYVHNYFVNNKIKLTTIIGVGGNNTYETLNFAKQCTNYCDGFMVTVPHYNKPTQNGIKLHFETICNDEAIRDHSIMMYNVPSRCGVNLEPQTILEIYQSCMNVVAIKEASGSMDQLIAIRKLVPELQVFAGDDKLILDFMVHGGSGVISVASNVLPKTISKCYEYADSGHYGHANKMFYDKILDYVNVMFCESNPIPIKYIMFVEKIYSSYKMRLPLTELSEDKRKMIDELMQLLCYGMMHSSIDDIVD